MSCRVSTVQKLLPLAPSALVMPASTAETVTPCALIEANVMGRLVSVTSALKESSVNSLTALVKPFITITSLIG